MHNKSSSYLVWLLVTFRIEDTSTFGKSTPKVEVFFLIQTIMSFM